MAKIKRIVLYTILGAFFLLLTVATVSALILTVMPVYNTLSSVYSYQSAVDNIVFVTNKDGNRSGAGIYIGDKHIITNAHVVDIADGEAVIATAKSEIITGTITYYDSVKDVAKIVLEKTPETLKPAVFKIQPPVIGEDVFQIGHPSRRTGISDMGGSLTPLLFSFSKGYVMYPSRKELNGSHSLQTDISAYYGNSGGGIFDSTGSVLGMTMSVINGTEITFSIPSSVICSIEDINCITTEDIEH